MILNPNKLLEEGTIYDVIEEYVDNEEAKLLLLEEFSKKERLIKRYESLASRVQFTPTDYAHKILLEELNSIKKLKA